MTFFCLYGKHTTDPGVKQIKKVVQTRKKVYPSRSAEKDPGGVGFETVHEINVCEDHQEIDHNEAIVEFYAARTQGGECGD